MPSNLEVKPYCWHFKRYESLVYFAQNSDSGADGSTYFYLVCDPNHVWWGRVVFYIYRYNRKFNVFNGIWSFSEFLGVLKETSFKPNKTYFLTWFTKPRVQFSVDEKDLSAAKMQKR